MGYVASQRGATVLVVCTVFESLALAAVALRLWSRRIKKVKLMANDYAMIVALILSSALVAEIMSRVATAGLGRHTIGLSKPELVAAGKHHIPTTIIWGCALNAVKISILHLYIVIFQIRWFTRLCYAAMAFSSAFCLMIILETILICRPLSFNWNPSIPHTCGNSQAAYLATHIFNLLTDLIIITLPTPVLWNLQMKVSKKIGISVMFGIGVVICCISVTRLCYSDRILTKDQTYTMVFLECLTMVEPLLGIVLACIPIARPAVIKIGQSSAVTLSLRRLRSTLTNSRQRGPDSIHSSSSSAEINKKSFHRLEENVYPLSDMARTVNNVESPAAARKDPYSSYHDSDMPPIGAISVTKTWDSGSATAV